MHRKYRDSECKGSTNRMSRLKSVLRNTGYLAIAETAKPALSFVLILVIARMLGRDGMGSYTVILTFTSLFELIATFGVGTMITRAIAAEPERLPFHANPAIRVADDDSDIAGSLKR